MTPSNDELKAALAELVPQGHTWRYIAEALNRRRIPNPSPRSPEGRWSDRAAERAAVRLGVATRDA